MFYALLCYDTEAVTANWTKEEDDAALEKLGAVERGLARAGRLGPVARLVPTSYAKTVRKGKQLTVLDGPFAETKEQLLGFFVIEAESLDMAVEAAKQFAAASSSNGAYEVRELQIFRAAPPAA
jgi:hypothetical protein